MAHYFAKRLLNYDFWDDLEMWQPIAKYGQAIRSYYETGKTGLFPVDAAALGEMIDKEKARRFAEHFREIEIPELWRQLSVLARVYEDYCREWFLPTALGFSSSYDPKRQNPPRSLEIGAAVPTFPVPEPLGKSNQP